MVLDNFSNSKKEEGVTVTDDDIDDFSVAWSKVDPKATGFIPVTRVATLLRFAAPPLGVRGTKISRLGLLCVLRVSPNPASLFAHARLTLLFHNHRRFQKNLNLKVESNYLHYQDMLQAVTARAMGINIEQLPMEVQTVLEVGKVRKRLTAERRLSKRGARDSSADGTRAGGNYLDITHGMAGVDGEELDVAQMYAVERIQAAFRGRQQRRQAAAAAAAAAEERNQSKATIVLRHVRDLMRSVEDDYSERGFPGGTALRGGRRGDSALASESEKDGEDRDSARLSE